jgi:hypothetical protein
VKKLKQDTFLPLRTKTYKGFIGCYGYCDTKKTFLGITMRPGTILSFKGKTKGKVELAFKKRVDEYLKYKNQDQ